jgi:hypothetical protein
MYGHHGQHGHHGQLRARLAAERADTRPFPAHCAARAARAARNRAHVRMLLEKNCPEFAAALNMAVLEICAEQEARLIA